MKTESKRCGALGRLLCFALLLGLALALPPTGRSAAASEEASVARLPAMGDHWIWIPDRLIQHSMLYDGDSGEVLGMVDSPSIITPKTPLVVRARNEIYSVDIAYSRGTRGERTDFISIYDLRTLDYKAEIVIPTQAGTSNTSQFYAELIGDRFLAVFNQFPNTSVSIVDLVERRFVEEIITTGCAGIYPIDAHRFASLCGNGTALLVELDENGNKRHMVASAKFFDVVKDPVAMSAGRIDQRWLFISFEGEVHEVDFSGPTPSVKPTWSLTSASERVEDWRPGGLQFVTLHSPSQTLWVVMHQGKPGSHKEVGSEIWAFDISKQERLDRIEPPNLTASFLASFAGIDSESFAYTLLEWLLPDGGVHTIVVSQDEKPLLFVRNGMLGSVGVLDALSGQTVRFLTEVGLAGPTLRVPQ